jgi:hypothetical protein
MSRKNLKTSVSIPLWQLIATALLLYLLPPPQSVEILLLSLLKCKQSVLAVKLLTVVLIILSFFYLKQKSNKPLSSKKKSKLLKIIKDMVETQYLLHTRNVLAKNFDELLEREATRGYTLPSGALAGAVSDLYITDIGIYSNLLKNALSKATLNITRKSLYPHLAELINEMLMQHLHNIKELYNSFVKAYFSNMGQNHVNLLKNSFATQAEKETELRAKNLSTINDLNQNT